MVKKADIFLTNLRLSERKKFGMGYETLSTLNPRLIYRRSVTGHGMNGPDKDMPAYDTDRILGEVGYQSFADHSRHVRPLIRDRPSETTWPVWDWPSA